MGITSSKRGAVLRIRQSSDSMVVVAGNSICKFSRLLLSRMGGRMGRRHFNCSRIWTRKPSRSPTNAGGGAVKLGRPLTRPFRLLQFPGEAGSVSAAVCERSSPTGNGSSNVCHRIGNSSSARIRGHGQARPELDDQRPVYCGPTELRVA